MTPQPTSRRFKRNVVEALGNDQLQRALTNVPAGFIDKRRKARDKLPEFDALRDQARDIKNHTLDHLDLYLEEYEAQVTASGGHVHWCQTPEDACAAVIEVCRKHSARTVT
ncbi:MAG: (Fe-S)-binding protein, partial [Aestuariivirgaceae bacterium]